MLMCPFTRALACVPSQAQHQFALILHDPKSFLAVAISEIFIRLWIHFMNLITCVHQILKLDQPWCNSYTKLLLRKKNRNYQLYKKINSEYISAMSQPNLSPLILTRLCDKKDRAFQKSRDAANQSTKANRRAKLDFYNTVNSTMHNNSISSKKKFSILTNLMKNSKNASIPPLLDNGKIVNDPQEKSELLN